MARALKWFFGIFGILVLLAAIFAVVVVLTLDPSVYRAKIEDAVETRTGRKLSLKGDISLTFYPWIGVELGTFSLSNPPGFGAKPFLKVEKSAVQVKLAPLMKGDVQVKGVELSGLNLTLITKPSGRTNWEDLSETGETHVTDEPEEDKPGEDDFIKSLFVGEVAILNAGILWDDHRNNQRYEIRKLNLKTGSLTPGEPFDITCSTEFESRVPDLRGNIDVAARVFIDHLKERFKAQGLKIDLAAQGGALPVETAEIKLGGDATYGNDRIGVSGLNLALKTEGGQLKKGGMLNADLSGDAGMDLKTQRASVKGLKLKADLDTADPGLKTSVNLAAEVEADLRKSALTLDGLKLAADASGAALGLEKSRVELSGDTNFNWDMMILNLKKLALSASAQGKKVPGGTATAQLKSDGLALGLKDENLNLKGLRLSTSGVNISGSVRGTSVMSDPNLYGTLKASPFNLKALLGKLGTKLDMQDPKALTDVGLSTDFTASKNAVSLKSLKLALDGSDLSGNLAVEGFKRPIPALTFRLKGDSLDADRYLPPKPAGGSGTSSSGSSSGKKNEEIIPVKTLRNLQVDGTLALNKFKINNLRMSNVNVNIRASGGKIDVRPLKLSMYEGGLNAALSMDVSRPVPHTTLNLDLSTFNLRPFLRDLTGKDSMGGRLNVRTALDTSGAELKDILAELSGSFAMNLKDCDIDKAGRFDNSVLLPLQSIGTSLEPLIQALAAMQTLNLGNSLPRLGGSEEKLASVVMDASAKRGMVTFNALEVLYPYLRINGKGGTMNLHDMTLNYPFTAKVVGSGKGQSADVQKETGGMTIPVNCRGSLQNPTCVPDPTAIIKGVLSQPIESPEDLLNNLGTAFGIGGKKKSEDTKKTSSNQKPSEPTQQEQAPEQAPEPVKQMQNLIKGLFN